MTAEPSESHAQTGSGDFIAELRHWREVSGVSQNSLAKLVSFDPSYVSKVERGSVVPSRSFVE
ncbi:MAG: helix-turn-helix domain-containing protein, partial [Actinobacteria bacterium]|nr:helix-turn-helix domain-containing protein [Actinomycetota bacterium]